jgi:penicillin G amidase
MKLRSGEILRRLGDRETIDSICSAAGLSREEFDRWWKSETASRVPKMAGVHRVGIRGAVEIVRDEWGVPHIFADRDEDLFSGFGYAMAQDRLFQLDYLRRKAYGSLAEVLGPDGLESDTVVRTVGINRIAATEEASMPAETFTLLNAFSGGVNAVIQASRDRLPIEFDLLGFQPEPWSPRDCLAIQVEFGWYLTGRFPVIVIPELAKRTLGDGPLYTAFLRGEADEESILPPGPYSAQRTGSDPVGATVGDPAEGTGSNNWVVSGARTDTGKPRVASDPHIAFAAVSCWYEVHLSGGSFDVTGMAYVGMPAVMFGRNDRVAWGLTNNICSLRDLYQEKTNPAHPGCFLYDGRWEPARELVEEVRIRDGKTVSKKIQFSRNGPIVDEILPLPARDSGPISLRWLGSTYSGWLAGLHRINRAKSAVEFRDALNGWKFPTWNTVFADVDGHIGYQAAGQIPVRKVWERGYRPGWDPKHQWEGLIPSQGMPGVIDPDRGWVATANNRPAPDDYPYPLSGTWSSGHRARRIRQMIEEKERLSREDFIRMQQDVLSLRAVDCLPILLKVLENNSTQRRRDAVECLRSWDCRMELDSLAATIFDVFFIHWSLAVVKERFAGEAVDLMSGAVGGIASDLLEEDRVGWFQGQSREAAVLEAFDAALEELSGKLGPDLSRWAWGNAHRISLKHVLSGRGDLGKLLDRGGRPVQGNGLTVCNTGYDPNWGALMGANYRLIADLKDSPAGLWAVDAQGQSGHPGSEHYCDQLAEWIAARYHYLPLNKGQVLKNSHSKLVLEPSGI